MICGTRSLKGELCTLEAKHAGGHSFKMLEEVRVDAELQRNPFVPPASAMPALVGLAMMAAAAPQAFVDPLFRVPRSATPYEVKLRAKRKRKNKQAKLSRRRNRGR